MNDLISRQAAIDALDCINGVEEVLKILPSAEPEYKLDEWCEDCKEYDKERLCCPRFNRVIRNTMDEVQPERKTGKWIKPNNQIAVAQDEWICSSCNYLVLHRHKFCPNCGAKMEG